MTKHASYKFGNRTSRAALTQVTQKMRTLIMLCLVLVSPASTAEVSENLVYNYYIAHGDPARSLLGILNAASPIRENGQIYHGHTKWYVRWNFRWFAEQDGRCRITSVTTELTGSISLPSIIDATPMQSRQFDNYLSALRLHELGHYALGKEAAAAIDAGILSLPEMPSCIALESAANDLGYRTINDAKDKEARYDASTGHGKSQGAWLDR